MLQAAQMDVNVMRAGCPLAPRSPPAWYFPPGLRNRRELGGRARREAGALRARSKRKLGLRLGGPPLTLLGWASASAEPAARPTGPGLVWNVWPRCPVWAFAARRGVGAACARLPCAAARAVQVLDARRGAGVQVCRRVVQSGGSELPAQGRDAIPTRQASRGLHPLPRTALEQMSCAKPGERQGRRSRQELPQHSARVQAPRPRP